MGENLCTIALESNAAAFQVSGNNAYSLCNARFSSTSTRLDVPDGNGKSAADRVLSSILTQLAPRASQNP